MISQQVNLYQDRFHDKKLLFSAQQVISLLVVLLLGGAYGSYFLQGNLDLARLDNYTIKQSQNKITAELNATHAELATLLADKRMDTDDSVSNVSGTTTSPDITLTPFFSGIALDVTPQISKDDEVILHIHPSISEVVDQTKEITLGSETLQLPLAFSTVREADTVVRALNGQVVVIGGLMQNISSKDDAGLPGVSDVPALGALFKQQSNRNNRSELVILLRPIVVGSNNTWSNYIKDSAGRMKKLRYVDSEGG